MSYKEEMKNCDAPPLPMSGSLTFRLSHRSHLYLFSSSNAAISAKNMTGCYGLKGFLHPSCGKMKPVCSPYTQRPGWIFTVHTNTQIHIHPTYKDLDRYSPYIETFRYIFIIHTSTWIDIHHTDKNPDRYSPYR